MIGDPMKSGTQLGPLASEEHYKKVRGYLDHGEHWIVGLMTGTSADAIDAALVRFEGSATDTTYTLREYRETPFDDGLRREILAVAGGESVPLERLMALDDALGRRYAEAVLALLESAGIEAAEVDAIGVGSGTILADDPLLTPRGAYRARPLTRVVFDRRLRTPPAVPGPAPSRTAAAR